MALLEACLRLFSAAFHLWASKSTAAGSNVAGAADRTGSAAATTKTKATSPPQPPPSTPSRGQHFFFDVLGTDIDPNHPRGLAGDDAEAVARQLRAVAKQYSAKAVRSSPAAHGPSLALSRDSKVVGCSTPVKALGVDEDPQCPPSAHCSFLNLCIFVTALNLLSVGKLRVLHLPY